jgi:hypothetical protein
VPQLTVEDVLKSLCRAIFSISRSVVVPRVYPIGIRVVGRFLDPEAMINTVRKKAPNPVDQHVGNRVRMRRMMLAMSQANLGNALGLTFQQVQKYEKGTNRIGASRLQHISHTLQPSSEEQKISERPGPRNRTAGIFPAFRHRD